MQAFDDEEFRAWSEAWKLPVDEGRFDAPAAIRSEVIRRSRQYHLIFACESVVLAVMLIFLVIFGVRSSEVHDRAMVLAFVVLIAAAFVRAVHVVRNTWAPAGESTQEFIDLMIRRAETTLTQVRLGWGVLVFEILVFVPWLLHTLENVSPPRKLGAWGFLGGLVAIAATFLLVLTARTRADLARWRLMDEELRTEHGDPPAPSLLE